MNHAETSPVAPTALVGDPADPGDGVPLPSGLPATAGTAADFPGNSEMAARMRATDWATTAEAIEQIVADRPDVHVSDIGMPVEDGYALIRRVRALGPARGGDVPAGQDPNEPQPSGSEFRLRRTGISTLGRPIRQSRTPLPAGRGWFGAVLSVPPSVIPSLTAVPNKGVAPHRLP